MIFPEGLVIDTEKRQYLTKNYNTFFELIDCLSIDFGAKKTGLFSNKTDKSGSVARSLEISNQTISDFIDTVEVAKFLEEEELFKKLNF